VSIGLLAVHHWYRRAGLETVGAAHATLLTQPRERDSQAGIDCVAPLASFTLILTDLAVAMLDTPSSVPPQTDWQMTDYRISRPEAWPARSTTGTGGLTSPAW
jgi:hypothetical protein